LPNELKNVKVNMISIVKAGANGYPVQLFKSADLPAVAIPPEVPVVDPATMLETPTAELEKSEKISLMQKIAKAMGMAISVNKAKDLSFDWSNLSFKDSIENKAMNLVDASYLFIDLCYDIIFDSSIENGVELALKNVDEFAAYAKAVLSSDTIKKEDIKKEEGAEEMTNTELLKALEPLQKSVSDLSAKVEELSKEKPVAEPVAEPEVVDKAAEENTPAVEAEAEVKKDTGLEEAINKMTDTIGSLSARIETVEKSRGISSQPEGTVVKKAAEVYKSDFSNVLHFD